MADKLFFGEIEKKTKKVEKPKAKKSKMAEQIKGFYKEQGKKGG